MLQPIALGPRTAPNRLLFGPHVTNLGDGRSISERHVAYYQRRAIGGCGVVVVEEASVHDSDWPYERSPRAEQCGTGWAAVADAVHAEGALAIAALGHAGGQGSSAYHQRPLWAPSRVPEVNTREVPKWMEAGDIAAVVSGFRAAAAVAAAAGLDGVEVNAGQHSLVRQFLSGLTNQRGDEWGQDRMMFARQVLAATREGLGPDAVLGLRLSCDELAPWAGITAEMAAPVAVELAGLVDYLVIVRGSIFSVEQTRPDLHQPTGINLELCRSIRAAVHADHQRVPIVLQGSVVDPLMAGAALDDGVADLVEMTRAQLADPDLGRNIAAGTPEHVRPCLRCNQTCQVRDARNPIVTCVVEPSTGYEASDPSWSTPANRPRRVLVVGGGPAGLECARVAANRGHAVELVERDDVLGGWMTRRGPGAPFAAWLEAECRRLGVALRGGVEVTAADLAAGGPADGAVVVVCTGSRPGERSYEVAPGATVLDLDDVFPPSDGSRRTVLAESAPIAPGTTIAPRCPDGVIAIWDLIGGPIGVALADELGERAILITPDQIAGNELSRSGDLAPANVRLQQRGVRIERRSLLRVVRSNEVELEDRFSGQRRTLVAAAVIDAGFRLPEDALWHEAGNHPLRAGDAVAPRTILEAVLEGRRAALAIDLRP